MATEKGLEPSTSGVTGRRSNQLNHSANCGRILPKTSSKVKIYFEKKKSTKCS